MYLCITCIYTTPGISCIPYIWSIPWICSTPGFRITPHNWSDLVCSEPEFGHIVATNTIKFCVLTTEVSIYFLKLPRSHGSFQRTISWFKCPAPSFVNYFSQHSDRVPERNALREEGFILAHCLWCSSLRWGRYDVEKFVTKNSQQPPVMWHWIRRGKAWSRSRAAL